MSIKTFKEFVLMPENRQLDISQQAEQYAAYVAKEFAEWLHYNQFVRYVQAKDGDVPYGVNKGSKENIWVSTKIHYGALSEYYTTSQLYDIFNQISKR